MYNYFCKSIIGQRYIDKGTPKEDYGTIKKFDDCLIFALGDGHGDPTCFRSQIGSEMICDIAVEILSSFCETVKGNNREKELFVERTAQLMVRQLVSVIFGTWKKRVAEHLKENPYTEEELTFMESKRQAGSKTIKAYDEGVDLEHIYGTTFIAGVLTDKFLLLLHQGDGKCSVMYSDGEYDEPVPWDDRCFSNVCTSVCDADSIESCRFSVINLEEKPVIACVLSSDGVEDCFAEDMDLVHSYYDGLLLLGAKNGQDALEKHLDETLPNMTKNGSHDDITICGFYYPDQIKKFEEKFEQRAESSSLQAALDDINRKIKSADGSPMMIALEKNLKESSTAFELIKAEYERLSEEKRSVTDDLKTLQKFDEVKEKYTKAQEKFDADKKTYDEYMERFNGFLSKREELLQKLADIKQ